MWYGCVKGRRADCRLLNDSLEKLFIMLMYGYVAKWKSRFVGWVALLSIIGEFVACAGRVVPGSRPAFSCAAAVCAFLGSWRGR